MDHPGSFTFDVDNIEGDTFDRSYVDSFSSDVDNIGDGTSDTAKSYLHHAFEDGSINYLLFNLCLNFPSIINYVSPTGITIFHNVVHNGDKYYLDTLHYALIHNPDSFTVTVNQTDNNGITPIMLATSRYAFDLLIQMGADPMQVDNNGYSVIVYILLYAGIMARGILEYALDRFPDLAQSNIVSAVRLQHVDPQSLVILIDYGFDINQRDGDGNTLLHNLAMDDPWDVNYYRQVISLGANLYGPNVYGIKPIHIMLESRHEAVRLYAQSLYHHDITVPNDEIVVRAVRPKTSLLTPTIYSKRLRQ